MAILKYGMENVTEAIKIAKQLYGLTEEEIENFTKEYTETENFSIDFPLVAYVSSILFEGGNKELEVYITDKSVPNSFKYSYLKNLEGKVSDKRFEKTIKKLAPTLDAKEDACSYFNFVNDFVVKKGSNLAKCGGLILPLMELENERYELKDGTFFYTATGVMKDYIQSTEGEPFNHIGIRADNLLKHHPLSQQLLNKIAGKKQDKEVLKYVDKLAKTYDVQAVDNMVASCGSKQEQM